MPVSIRGMNSSSNLFLIGPMGAGKSTIGRKLAQQFAMTFIDLDREIERATGATVNLIFEIEGETSFRIRESRLLDALSRRMGIVLATGGGAVLAPENRERLSARGFVLYLQTEVELQLDRLKRDRTRPLMQCEDPRARLQNLAEQRNVLYAQIADLTWNSAAASARQSAGLIAERLPKHWQRVMPQERPTPDRPANSWSDIAAQFGFSRAGEQ